MPQVVFTDVLIVGRLDVYGQSFAPVGLHKIDAASDWLLINVTALLQKASRESSYKLIGLHKLLAWFFSIYRVEAMLNKRKSPC